jgi:hypothetical protein
LVIVLGVVINADWLGQRTLPELPAIHSGTWLGGGDFILSEYAVIVVPVLL